MRKEIKLTSSNSIISVLLLAMILTVVIVRPKPLDCSFIFRLIALVLAKGNKNQKHNEYPILTFVCSVSF